MRTVVISVDGGVADIAFTPEDVQVQIVDFDNLEAEGKSGDERDLILRNTIAEAEEESMNE